MSTTRKASADFDFLMGTWKMPPSLSRAPARRLPRLDRVRRIAARRARSSTASATSTRTTSSCQATAITASACAPGIPTSKRWSIYWLDSRRPGHLFPPVHGGFDKGVGTFYGDDTFEGRAIRVRYLWSRITDSTARWEQAFSLDEGNNWETNWYMDFTRV